LTAARIPDITRYNRFLPTKEALMAVKILIKRRVPVTTAKEIIVLFRQMRILATAQQGYISGETLRSMDDPEEFLVISTWNSVQDWENWLKSKERREVQARIDLVLGGETHYERFHYGFAA
jgi:heme oxygenase (mycobilin-producing)